MFIIYDLIFILISLIFLPIYLWKRKFHRGFALRFGFFPQDLKFERPIWIHAVSVGEAMSIKGLVAGLRKDFAHKKFIFSTVTPTGNKIIKDVALAGDYVTYLPLDLSFIVRIVINRINPAMFIIAETEIWPNIISYCYKKNIPVVVVNGRISRRSFNGYLLVKPLVSRILNKVSLFCVQSATDAQRLTRLGAKIDKIKVTGNMKFDIQDSSGDKGQGNFRKTLGLKADDKVLIAASTHPQEEELVLNVYRKLIEEQPNLRLIIAPRHPERAEAIASLIDKKSFKPLKISSLGSLADLAHAQGVFILDTIGELMKFYLIADIVFVGGSLVKKGGHNILEPASLGKPVLFGPYIFNFSDIAELFLENNAAILVRNENELLHAVRDLLQNPAKIFSISQQQQSIILNNRGATERNLKKIKSLLCIK